MWISHGSHVPLKVETHVEGPSAAQGEVRAPAVTVWPAGRQTPQDMAFYWSLSAEEAEVLGKSLLDGARRLRALFPGA
jgi:hypothetical protein